MRIAQEEIFGPVLVIIPFENEQEAVAIANDTPYGLAAYLQTGNPERARRVAAKLRTGSVHINGGGINYGTPFGGYKQSGNGREGGMMGLEDYLETKTLHGLTLYVSTQTLSSCTLGPTFLRKSRSTYPLGATGCVEQARLLQITLHFHWWQIYAVLPLQAKRQTLLPPDLQINRNPMWPA